jgi:hypothetical protein
MRGQHLVVVRAIGIRRAVHAGRADLAEHLEVDVLAGVHGALEHHVLEEMREAGLARRLVSAADVVPDRDRDERHAAIGVEDDLDSVVEDVSLVRKLGVCFGREQ